MTKKSQKAIDRMARHLSRIENIHQVREHRAIMWGHDYDPFGSQENAEVYGPQPVEFHLDGNAGFQNNQYDNGGTLEGSALSSGFVIPSAAPLVPIVMGRVKPPTGNRANFNRARINAAKNSRYAGFVRLDTSKFYFTGSGGEAAQNRFAPDFAAIMYLVYDALVNANFVKAGEKIRINSGLRANPVASSDGTVATSSPHMGGIAVDIGAQGADRYKVADACWGLGIRAIAIGNSFTHIDCGVAQSWKYGSIPKYTGPSGRVQ